jgi:site-specific DNA recombinase
VEREHDDRGRLTARHYRRDPDRAPIIERMFAFSLEGIGDPTIARRLNSEGHRTKHGKPWTRRAVQSALTNPFDAGHITYYRDSDDEQVIDGQHPALIDPKDFDRLRQLRYQRDLSGGKHTTGRLSQNHVAECRGAS